MSNIYNHLALPDRVLIEYKSDNYNPTRQRRKGHGNEREREEIAATLLAIEKGINERWNKGDVDGALEIYSDDVTYFDPMTEMRLEGRKAVEAYFRRFFEGKLNILRNEFPNPQAIISEAGDMAVVSYNLVNYVSDGQAGEKLDSPRNATMVYRQIDGRWRVVHVNWSFTRHPAVMQALMA